MIELSSQPASSFIRVELSAKLRHEDFGKLRTWVEAEIVDKGSSRVLMVFGDFRGWDARAFLDDVQFHTVWSARVDRVAYVGNKWWEGAMVRASAPLTRCAVRYFDASEGSAAAAWLEEPARGAVHLFK
jgi:hypothetical protein